MKKILIATTIFCAALTSGVGAQSPLGLTYPLGVPDLAVSGAAAAMSGSGTAVVNEYLGASVNPANAAVGGRSVFSALVSFDMISVYDGGATSSVSGYTPKYISLIVPVGAAGNLNFSMQKRYDANLNFYTEEVNVWQRPTEWWYLYSGTVKTTVIEVYRAGGLSSWQVGWAYRFGNGVGIGLVYERLFFNYDSRNVFESKLAYELDDGNFYVAKVTDSVVAAFAGNGIRFGVQVPVHEKVTLGFAGEYIAPGSGNGTETSGSHNSDAVLTDWGRRRSLSVTLPPSMNIGISYRPDDHWLIAADAGSVLWDFYEKSYDGRPSADTKPERELGLSVGARYVPSANVFSSKYWEKIHYSVGARYATLPNSKAYDRAREYAFSAGAGLPIPRDGGMVDIVVSFGQRSDPKYSKYEENIVKLQLGLNGGRNWFQKDASKEY